MVMLYHLREGVFEVPHGLAAGDGVVSPLLPGHLSPLEPVGFLLGHLLDDLPGRFALEHRGQLAVEALLASGQHGGRRAALELLDVAVDGIGPLKVARGTPLAVGRTVRAVLE